jgi:hypothetical protein
MIPRCLNRRQAADYCGCGSLSAFDDWVRRGIVPGPITGTRRWDRKAIDAALDKRSNLVAASSSSLNPRETADQALHEWLQGADWA